jgi:hypothetical protein
MPLECRHGCKYAKEHQCQERDALSAKRAFARAMLLKKGSKWQIAYEMVNGERTGRWQMLNESGEMDDWWPGEWLPEPAP